MQIEENALENKLTNEQFDERMMKCGPLAKDIIRLIATNIDTITLGKMEDISATTATLSNDILQLCLDADVAWWDIDFALKLVLQPFAHIGEKIAVSQTVSWDKFMEKKMGKSTLEVTAREVDEALREVAPVDEAVV